jgi:hypothetical protein
MRLFRNTATSILTVLVIVSPTFCRAQENEIEESKVLKTYWHPAQPLLEWPDQSVLTGPKRVKSDAHEVRFPKNECLGWIRRVLAPSWRPPKQTEMFFIRDEFDQYDVVRMSWERNGYNIQVSQTRGKMAIKLTPLEKEHTGQDVTQKTEKARQLCLSLFSDKGKRRDRKLRVVPVNGLSKKIAAYSFRPDMILYREDKKVVYGRPQRLEESGIAIPRNNEEKIQQQDPNNPDWDKTVHSFSYWFRMIRWRNDGKSVAFCFSKCESKSEFMLNANARIVDSRFF